LTLLAYHLALDAQPEIGNNTLLAAALGVDVERVFALVGQGGRLPELVGIEEFIGRVRKTVGREPLVFAHGPERIERVTICSALGIHFVAGGHDATERLGVQALSQRLAERFDLEWESLPVENPV